MKDYHYTINNIRPHNELYTIAREIKNKWYFWTSADTFKYAESIAKKVNGAVFVPDYTGQFIKCFSELYLERAREIEAERIRREAEEKRRAEWENYYNSLSPVEKIKRAIFMLEMKDRWTSADYKESDRLHAELDKLEREEN